MLPEIKIVDSIMGSGKTTWAIEYMNANPDNRFIFCTPYCEEVRRIVENCPRFCEPEEINEKPKQVSFLQHLADGDCIATTHELFKRLCVNERMIHYLEEYEYVLILDEVLEIIEKIDICQKDMDTLFNSGYAEVEPEKGVVRWLESQYESHGVFARYRRLINTKSVIRYKDNLLLWLFPPQLLFAFKEIFVLTFMFPGSTMEQYLLINQMQYTICHIEGGMLIPGAQDLFPEKQRIRRLLDIYDGTLNAMGNKRGAYSATWWRKADKDSRRIAENNAYSCVKNVFSAHSDEILWTKIKGNEKVHRLKERWSDCFCPCNTRATNMYRDRKYLAYLVNVFLDPAVSGWFLENGGCLDEKQFALSQLLQWVWRSAIRDGKCVRLYLPSRRMREMLIEWLER